VIWKNRLTRVEQTRWSWSVSRSNFQDYVILWSSLTCWDVLSLIVLTLSLICRLDSRMSFARLIDVTVENTLAMLGLVYTYIEIVCCVWRPFYDVHTSLGLSVCRESLLDRHCEYWDMNGHVRSSCIRGPMYFVIRLETLTRRLFEFLRKLSIPQTWFQATTLFS
jgi:hypothetical protein